MCHYSIVQYVPLLVPRGITPNLLQLSILEVKIEHFPTALNQGRRDVEMQMKAI